MLAWSVVSAWLTWTTRVLCFDIDQSKIALLNAGGATIHELGLADLVKRNLDAGRLRFNADPLPCAAA